MFVPLTSITFETNILKDYLIIYYWCEYVNIFAYKIVKIRGKRITSLFYLLVFFYFFDRLSIVDFSIKLGI